MRRTAYSAWTKEQNFGIKENRSDNIFLFSLSKSEMNFLKRKKRRKKKKTFRAPNFLITYHWWVGIGLCISLIHLDFFKFYKWNEKLWICKYKSTFTFIFLVIVVFSSVKQPQAFLNIDIHLLNVTQNDDNNNNANLTINHKSYKNKQTNAVQVPGLRLINIRNYKGTF